MFKKNFFSCEQQWVSTPNGWCPIYLDPSACTTQIDECISGYRMALGKTCKKWVCSSTTAALEKATNTQPDDTTSIPWWIIFTTIFTILAVLGFAGLCYCFKKVTYFSNCDNWEIGLIALNYKSIKMQDKNYFPFFNLKLGPLGWALLLVYAFLGLIKCRLAITAFTA